jgi:hypothetical protein
MSNSTSMTLLESAVTEFLEQRLQGECIDRLTLPRPAKHADYFLCDRKVVVEIKSITEDRVGAASGILDKWRAEADWPLVYGSPAIQQVLQRHPRGAQVNEELFTAVTSSVEWNFEKANRQIRETIDCFGLPGAYGVLFLLNQDVDLLDPKVLASKLGQLLEKKLPGGDVRFPYIDSVLVFTWAHKIVGDDSVEMSPIVAVSRPLEANEAPGRTFENYLMGEWASFLGVPITYAGYHTAPGEFLRLKIAGKSPPPVL